jgi:hypothetical protein
MPLVYGSDLQMISKLPLILKFLSSTAPRIIRKHPRQTTQLSTAAGLDVKICCYFVTRDRGPDSMVPREWQIFKSMITMMEIFYRAGGGWKRVLPLSTSYQKIVNIKIMTPRVEE